MKVLTHIIAASVIAYFMYRTVRKALNDAPEEERIYTSPEAAIIEGADDDDDWFLEPE